MKRAFLFLLVALVAQGEEIIRLDALGRPLLDKSGTAASNAPTIVANFFSASGERQIRLEAPDETTIVTFDRVLRTIAENGGARVLIRTRTHIIPLRLFAGDNYKSAPWLEVLNYLPNEETNSDAPERTGALRIAGKKGRVFMIYRRSNVWRFLGVDYKPAELRAALSKIVWSDLDVALYVLEASHENVALDVLLEGFMAMKSLNHENYIYLLRSKK
jgi:hypothetical protein